MTYCSKKECALGIACKRHILNIPKNDVNPHIENLRNDKVFCIIKKCQEKPCKSEDK